MIKNINKFWKNQREAILDDATAAAVFGSVAAIALTLAMMSIRYAEYFL